MDTKLFDEAKKYVITERKAAWQNECEFCKATTSLHLAKCYEIEVSYCLKNKSCYGKAIVAAYQRWQQRQPARRMVPNAAGARR